MRRIHGDEILVHVCATPGQKTTQKRWTRKTKLARLDSKPNKTAQSMSKRSPEEVTATMVGTTTEKKTCRAIPSRIVDVLRDLRALETPGSPSVGGKAPVPALPGLAVSGVGMVSLPLVSDEIVKQLSSVAVRSPFGKGSDTVLDDSVRKSWQIEPAQVRLDNPVFHDAIDSLAKSAARGLGVPENVSVEAMLCKVLLCEPGGFFRKHRDAEKEDGMFATLAVQLPSVCTGGNLKVWHGEDMPKTHSVGTDDGTAPCGCHFVAHFADCEHEVEAVESGHRLALVCSLCHKKNDTGLQVPTTEMATGPAMKLGSTLERLPTPKQLMFFPLRHCYATVSLARCGLEALKGRDSTVLRAFQLDGTWKFRIFRLARTCEECDSDFLEDFDESKQEHRRIHTSEFCGEASFEEVCWTEDTDNRVSDEWLTGRKSLCISCDDNGRVLASSDDIADAWKRIDQIEKEHAGNDGCRERETKCQCYTLMACKTEAELELAMEHDISGAIEMVVKTDGKMPNQVDRLFDVLRSLPPRELEVDTSKDAEKALNLLGEPMDGEFLEEECAKSVTSCVNLIVFQEVRHIGRFWTKLGNIVARCAKAKNAEMLVTHFLSLLAKPIEGFREVTVKAYMVALVSVKAPNVSLDAMVQTLVGAIDPEKLKRPSCVNCAYEAPDVLKSMMQLDITPSIFPLVRKLFPLWKTSVPKFDAYKLIPVVRCKMDACATQQWIDEIVATAVDEDFLHHHEHNLKAHPTLVHLVFEGGTDDHVDKLSSIANDGTERAFRIRLLLLKLWKEHDGPTRSQAWIPLMKRLEDGATEDTVERLLVPEKLLKSCWDKLEDHSELVHFLFENGSDENIIKLLEIVDSEGEKPRKIREGLLRLYKAYVGVIKGEHAWATLIPRLEKTE